MSTFATAPTGFKDIFFKSIQNWWFSLKIIWPLLLLLVLLKESFCPTCMKPNLHTSFSFFLLLFGVMMVDVSLWAAISAAIYHAFRGEVLRFWHGLAFTARRAFWLLMALLLYSIFISLAGLGGYGLGSLVVHYTATESIFRQIIPILIGFPMLYVIVLFLFALPLLLVDNLSVWGSLVRSAQLTYRHWFRAFFAYVMIVLFLSAMHGLYLLQLNLGYSRWVDVAAQLGVMLLLVPFVANFYVLVMHDLSLRENLSSGHAPSATPFSH